MGNIERTDECPEHGDTLNPTRYTEHHLRWCEQGEHFVAAVQVEYVPASQLRGAVEALQFYAQQYGVGARLASDGGSLARQTLRSMGVEPRAGRQ